MLIVDIQSMSNSVETQHTFLKRVSIIFILKENL